MTRKEKEEFYEEMCKVLTNFENGDDSNCDTVADDMYRFLVKLRNNWEEYESIEFMNQLDANQRYRWRPSYKQMDALKWTIEKLESYDQVVYYLEELFEELKEL